MTNVALLDEVQQAFRPIVLIELWLTTLHILVSSLSLTRHVQIPASSCPSSTKYVHLNMQVHVVQKGGNGFWGKMPGTGHMREIQYTLLVKSFSTPTDSRVFLYCFSLFRQFSTL